MTRTRVAIAGPAGPAGPTLAQLLHVAATDSVVLENRSLAGGGAIARREQRRGRARLTR